MIFNKLFKRLFKRNQKIQNDTVDTVYVTLGWDGHPITTKGDGYILPRRAENILNKQYYPTREIGEWPIDPITGEKLPIESNK